MLKDDGSWMEKTELKAIHATDGSDVVPIPSSFNTEIALDKKVTSEEMLNYVISSVYQLDGDNISELVNALGNDIYTFQFSYRGGSEASTGFLLSNGQIAYIFVGQEAQFDFIGLDDQGVLDESDEETEMEDDELDFSMM